MKTANLIALFVLQVFAQSPLTTSHDDTTTFALSLIGCDTTMSSSSAVGYVARVYIGTLGETPVWVRLSMSASVTSTADDVPRKHHQEQQQQQQPWHADVTVRKHEPQYITLPYEVVCSPFSNNGINTNGILIVAQGQVDVYVVIGCLPSSGELCLVRDLRPIHSSSNRQYVVPDGSVDGATFQPRRLVVESVRDNTTVHVVRLGDGQNGTSRADFNNSHSAELHKVVLHAHQTFTFDAVGTMKLEQLDDGDWSVGDLIGVSASEPVSVVLESVVGGTVGGVVVQLEPIDGWGNSFVLWRPIYARQLQEAGVQWRSFARIIAGRDGATIVRIQYWKTRPVVRSLLLPDGYRHFDVDISSGLAAGGVVRFNADRPISVLQLIVTRRQPTDRSDLNLVAESATVEASANCVQPSDNSQLDDVWMTSYCGENGTGFIGTNTASGRNLEASGVQLDGRKITVDEIEMHEREGEGFAAPSGNVSGVLLIRAVSGLHYVTLLDLNITRRVFVECRHYRPALQHLNQNTSFDATTRATSSEVDVAPSRSEQTAQTHQLTTRRAVDVNTPSQMTSSSPSPTNTSMAPDSSLELNDETNKVPYGKPLTSIANGVTIAGRDDIGDVIGDVTDNSVMPCGVNGSSANCSIARVALETFNYSYLGSEQVSLTMLVSNKVSADDEHFFHHVERSLPSSSLISSPTVIAVIASLAVAIFFVIACIVGFVVAELVCNKGSLQRVKVSPFVDDYD